MHTVKFRDAGARQQELWHRIMYYPLREMPDDLDGIPLSIAIAKRAIVSTFEDAELPYNIVDLLADLRHLCDALELDFDDCDRVAKGHYECEREGR